MLLAIDVGNTQTHVGAFEGGGAGGALALRHGPGGDRRPARRRASTSCWACGGSSSATSRGGDLVGGAPACCRSTAGMFDRYLDREALIVGAGHQDRHADPARQPTRAGRRPPGERGRRLRRCREPAWSWTSAPRSPTTRCPAPASTSEASSRPGIEISIEALASRAARLPKVDIEPPRALIGKIDRRLDPVRDRLRLRRPGRRHLPPPARRAGASRSRTIATGGLASVIVGFTETIDIVDDLLTLKGLRLIYERNR